MALPFTLIATEGIHSGTHGALLRSVEEIAVEVLRILKIGRA